MKSHELKTVMEVFEKKVLEVGETKLISNRNLQEYELHMAKNAAIVMEQGRLIQYYRNAFEAMIKEPGINAEVMLVQIKNISEQGEAMFEKLKNVIAPPVF
jgi:hypothetical protein